MSSKSRSRFLLAGLALLAALSIAVVSLNNSADAGALVPGDATCNGIFNESDILPTLEEIAVVGEGANCPHNANVLCEDPLDTLDVLMLLYLLTDIDTDATPCIATPTPHPTGTPSTATPATATVTPTGTPRGTPGTITPGTITPVSTATPGPTVTPTATPGPTVTTTITPAATATPAPTPQVCDQPLLSGSLDALDAAKAIGVCAPTSASWLKPDGIAGPNTPAFNNGHSIRPQFGSNVEPREGSKLLVLSSGAAAAKGDTNPTWVDPHTAVNKSYSSPYPLGFPKSNPNCPDPVGNAIYDGIAFQMVVTAPPGASAFSFDWKFYSDDYPTFVCSSYSDTAAVTVDGNDITYTSVNDPRIDQCESGPTGQNGTPGSKSDCIGILELAGTGYDEHPSGSSVPDEGAATSWVTSTYPVAPSQSYTIMFMIWDTSDYYFDSTMLVDNFHWLSN